jgi:RNA polymerase-binding transcription factor DksA
VETKPAPKVEVKPAAKVEVKTAPKPPAKAPVKVEAKPAPKVEVKSAAKVEVKTAPKQPAKAPVKVEAKPVEKVAAKVPPVAEKPKEPVKIAPEIKKTDAPLKHPTDGQAKVTIKDVEKPVVKAEPQIPGAIITNSGTVTIIKAKKPAKMISGKEEPIEEGPKPKPNVRYSDEDLDMFEGRIHNERKNALDELRMLKERLEDLTNYDYAEESMIYSMHMAEQGSEALEKEKTYAQIQRINEYLKKLDDAMQRIKEKSYGICRMCGCLIAKERLLAVPITTLSAAYKIHKRCPEDGVDRIEPVAGK